MGSNRFVDGLLWGALIGGAAVFLLGTKKGNKLLKIITEEGMESLNHVVSEIEEDIGDFRKENIKEAKNGPDPEANGHTSHADFEEVLASEKEVVKEKTRPRRFFKSTR